MAKSFQLLSLSPFVNITTNWLYGHLSKVGEGTGTGPMYIMKVSPTLQPHRRKFLVGFDATLSILLVPHK